MIFDKKYFKSKRSIDRLKNEVKYLLNDDINLDVLHKNVQTSKYLQEDIIDKYHFIFNKINNLKKLQ